MSVSLKSGRARKITKTAISKAKTYNSIFEAERLVRKELWGTENEKQCKDLRDSPSVIVIIGEEAYHMQFDRWGNLISANSTLIKNIT